MTTVVDLSADEDTRQGNIGQKTPGHKSAPISAGEHIERRPCSAVFYKQI